MCRARRWHEHLRAVVAHVADSPVARRRCHAFGRVGAEQIDRWLVCLTTFEPAVVIAWLQDDRHAVVDFAGELVGGRGVDGKGLQPFPVVRILLGVPKPGEGEGRSIAHDVSKRLLHFWRKFLPLVEAIRGHEATPLLKRSAPQGSFRNRFGLGVDR